MKVPHASSILFFMGLTTACQSYRPACDDVVCETYIHRYGVPLEPHDWLARGQHGQVASTRKDGVIMTSNYEAGVLHGECTYTFPHRDTIQKKEIYNQGVVVQQLEYYSSGLPYQQLTYESPTRQSLISWYENGAPQCRENYENWHLVQGEYYNLDHQVESQVDNFNGLRTLRDGQGQLLFVDTIENGQMVYRTTYHPNGAPASLNPYVNGVIKGQRRTFLPGGEPATIEEWDNSAPHGIATLYEHGDKVADVPYIKGRKHGIERRYRDNGQTIVQEVTWVQGKKQGPCYNYVGNTSTTDWYFRDRKVNKATYDMLMNQ